MRRFNTTGICYPKEHYMVNMERRLQEMESLVDRGAYFTMNRARQYGKTTLLNLLTERLSARYSVFSISFEGMSEDVYETETKFGKRVCGLLSNALDYHETEGISEHSKSAWKRMGSTEIMDTNLFVISNLITEMCREADKPIILIIDEVDQASGQKIFLSFLGMLRDKYLKKQKQPTFQSVILAGVYDIKNLKLKMRPDSAHQYNSPWNIAEDFTVDMSFQTEDIAQMLEEYESDRHTGMNIFSMAQEIYAYTSGYPFLVSRLCKIMDEFLPPKMQTLVADHGSVWNREGLGEAVKELLTESNPLFDDMIKKLQDFPELKKMLYAILFNGENFPYNPDVHEMNIGMIFGLIKREEGIIAVANRIFETRLYNWFMAEDILDSKLYKAAVFDKNSFVQNHVLDMKKVLEHFTEAFTDIYADAEEAFLEENGRRFFLLYLKPIINGVGNYYVEARTRNMRRTDVIIDYCGKQYVCELKIWHGKEYHQRGEKQLIEYLNDYHLDEGYMVSFNFNQKKNVGVQELVINGKKLIEAVV